MGEICCFAGHSELYDSNRIYRILISVIEELIVGENINEFWTGNYGDFDKLSAKAVRDLKNHYPHVKLNLVIPYLTSEINQYKEIYYRDYDSILLSEISENTPRNLRIIKNNQYMIDKSQVLVCYVKRSWGGASKTLEYAKKRKNIEILNIAEY